jgi:predicted nucleotidyltransferase
MLLSGLTQALRTERAVRLAVLFGSVARGSERPGSDLDVLVDMSTQEPAAMAGLLLRLTCASAREAHLVVLAQAEAQAPQVLLSAIDDGRVLTDRDGGWVRLCRRRPELGRAAEQSRDRARREASEALAALGGRL